MDRIQVRNISRFMGDERLTIGRRTGLIVAAGTVPNLSWVLKGARQQ